MIAHLKDHGIHRTPGGHLSVVAASICRTEWRLDFLRCDQAVGRTNAQAFRARLLFFQHDDQLAVTDAAQAQQAEDFFQRHIKKVHCFLLLQPVYVGHI